MQQKDDAQLLNTVLDGMVEYLTPTIEEVADWHFVDTTLRVDFDRPLVRALFNLVDPPSEGCIDLRSVAVQPEQPTESPPNVEPAVVHTAA